MENLNSVPEHKCSCNETVNEDLLYDQLDEIIEMHRGKEGALIPILQSAQNLFGYLPEAALKQISRKLHKPYSEVAGVVGFYSYFSTVAKGKHTVRVCMGTACYVRGGKDVLKSLMDNLGINVGETTENRLFSLEVGRCFGACGLAPVIMIDDTVYQKVKPSKVSEILDTYTE
ncbi:MAG: NAD(P)H-dependent oxidoreductase subunit E [Bacteroidales bacterium]|nr:NAD(P)H-dependent oxidoreductase subunit E [Bacteroidales bacterium]MBN2820188.1 NAD(P)H-dependent oxidoreductase subunit E [Bacteroidales bacterium]